MNLFKSKTLNTASHLSLGVRGEMAAQNYLKKCGYKIIATNYANTSGRRLGEIDIIAKDGGELVFIEVKTRSSATTGSGLPEENITTSKLYKLNKAASFYVSQNKLFETTYRFDAITIMANCENNTAKLRHLKNIFI